MLANKFKAGDLFPELVLPTTEGGDINLAKPSEDQAWRLVVIYRGKHCPLCTRYLNTLEEKIDELGELGIDVVAASADSREQALEHLTKMPLSFPVAYGLSIEQMQNLGLYISLPRSPEETDHPFSEPGLFVINSDGRAQVIDISNGPFARPELDTLIAGLGFIRNPDNNYPIRGTYQNG